MRRPDKAVAKANALEAVLFLAALAAGFTAGTVAISMAAGLAVPWQWGAAAVGVYAGIYVTKAVLDAIAGPARRHLHAAADRVGCPEDLKR